MKSEPREPLSRAGRIFADGRRIDAALRRAVRDAIREHAAVNADVVIWRDGAVALVPARELLAKTRSRRRRTRARKR